MAEPTASGRLASLDQYRGYTVLGMFFVNFVGSFAVIPLVFKHHNIYCSYADTIMPQFFFAVGFAYRLTLLRRLKSAGPRAAYLHVVQRNLGLLLLGFVIHHISGEAKTWAALEALTLEEFISRVVRRDLFQTLVHIAVTSLWVMPVIAAAPVWRIAFACFSGLLHLALSAWFYYSWVHIAPGIDGGPLGFLTWTIPLLAGSLAYDVVSSGRTPGGKIKTMLGWGAILMVAGYLLSCIASRPALRPEPEGVSFRLAELPFVPPTPMMGSAIAVQAWSEVAQQQSRQAIGAGPLPYILSAPQVAMAADMHRWSSNLWTMSQRAGSLTYLTFATGFALALYAVFYWLCDVRGWQLGVFRTLGSNALAGYVIHDFVADAFHPYAPADAPAWYILTITGLYFGVCYLFLRHLEKHKLFLRL